MKINKPWLAQGLSVWDMTARRMKTGGLTPPQITIKRAEPVRLKPRGNATLVWPRQKTGSLCKMFWVLNKYWQPSQHFKNYYASQIGVSGLQLLVLGALHTNVSGSSWTAQWLTVLNHLLSNLGQMPQLTPLYSPVPTHWPVWALNDWICVKAQKIALHIISAQSVLTVLNLPWLGFNPISSFWACFNSHLFQVKFLKMPPHSDAS